MKKTLTPKSSRPLPKPTGAWVLSKKSIVDIPRQSTAGLSPDEKQMLEDRDFEREIALLDARFERGDWAAGREQIETLLAKYPGNAEILQRKSYLDEMTQNTFSP